MVCFLAPTILPGTTNTHISTHITLSNRLISPPLSSRPLSFRRRAQIQSCASSDAPSFDTTLPKVGSSARGETARRLAKWISAEWSNRAQAVENPPLWSHIHVTFRPLPWSLLNGYAMYTESAYDYDLATPYKTSIVHIVYGPNEQLELASYKLRDADEFWSGVFEPSLLESLTRDHLTRLRDECNTVFNWMEGNEAFIAGTRPGKLCRIRRGGKEKETYLDSKIMLTKEEYKAWDVGRDPETDERVWGTIAGPFDFQPLQRFDHLVPDEEDGGDPGIGLMLGNNIGASAGVGAGAGAGASVGKESE